MRTRYRYDIRKDDLAALINANYCVSEMAGFYGCDRSVIYYWADKYGLDLKMPVVRIDRAKLQKMIAEAPLNRASPRAAE